uniref:Uncharacterized protein n=1 Tax=Pipistrellus kuhlii TaxID=59472 RepID=A0A7J7VUV9_PIPKU|nr:hypothetical protein mPipKuh1_008266 [Pipistrellus kuhlii]
MPLVPGQEIINFFIVIVTMLIVDCELSCTYLSMCLLFYFLSNPRGSLTLHPPLLSSTSLIYHQWISCYPPKSPSLIAKIGEKLPFSRALFQYVEILLPGCSQQFGSNKPQKFITGLNVFTLTAPCPYPKPHVFSLIQFSLNTFSQNQFQYK